MSLTAHQPCSTSLRILRSFALYCPSQGCSTGSNPVGSASKSITYVTTNAENTASGEFRVSSTGVHGWPSPDWQEPGCARAAVAVPSREAACVAPRDRGSMLQPGVGLEQVETRGRLPTQWRDDKEVRRQWNCR